MQSLKLKTIYRLHMLALAACPALMYWHLDRLDPATVEGLSRLFT